MNVNWKHSAGALALSVAMLASTGGQMVAAAPVETGQLLIKDKPKPPSVEKGKSATIPVELPMVDAPATEKGIKDKGMTSCGNCGLTGKEAAPPPVDDGAAPPSTEFGVDGQILDRGKGRPLSAAERRAHNGPGGTPPATAAARNKTGWIFPTVAAITAATLVAVVASGNNDDNPTSP